MLIKPCYNRYNRSGVGSNGCNGCNIMFICARGRSVILFANPCGDVRRQSSLPTLLLSIFVPSFSSVRVCRMVIHDDAQESQQDGDEDDGDYDPEDGYHGSPFRGVLLEIFPLDYSMK